MRRAIVTSTATVSGVVLLLGMKATAGGQHPAQAVSIGTGSGAAVDQGSGQTTNQNTDQGSGTTGSSGTGASPTTAPTTTGGTKTTSTAAKTVTGDAASTRYGPVQLKVTFSGSKITKIDVVQYPTESGRDVQINEYALPILNQEAMSAQNAQIDVVSGATYTSDGYAQSLQSAIDKAKA